MLEALLLSSLVAALGCAAPASPESPTSAGVASRAESYGAQLNTVPDASRLRAWHDLLGSEPHIAGTPGDERNIRRIEEAFEAMGLEVDRHDVWVYLAYPIRGAVEIVAPTRETLPVRERALEDDPDSGHPDLPIGFNAYSGNGVVTGEVVYANYGRKEDFEKLRELGVEVRGRIVLARYGGNFRGFKAKFAEEAGAAGLIIFTDPGDSGYRKGLLYPEGGFANETSIQRGSIMTTPYPGDPLTPFEESTRDAPRIESATAGLPTIPVQPVGWAAAGRILERMEGRALPDTLFEGWPGGLPFPYRLEGGDALRVRLEVEQERRIAKTSNVIARLPGSANDARADELVILGCHHDAWGHGAADPLAGLIVLLESARSFAEAARRGENPSRTVLFAAWGAEEHGIIGSTEWCEANRDLLAEQAVAYLNLDMAAMGPRFRASAAPALKAVIADAAREVPAARTASGETVFDTMSKDDASRPAFGNLGGGSDHVGFYCHLGIPSAGLGAGGSFGTSYHSNYDTLHWYRKVVGEDYEPALMVTRMTNEIAARLAAGHLPPLDPVRPAADARGHLAAIAARAADLEVAVDFSLLEQRLLELESSMEPAWARLKAGASSGSLSDDRIRRAAILLRMLEREWLDDGGLPGRPWYRSLYAASDPDSGYSAWMLPALRGAVESRRDDAVEREIRRYLAVIKRLMDSCSKLDTLVAGGPPPPPD